MPLTILRIFLEIGSMSFGGYMSMVMLVRKKIVEEVKLISENDFSTGLALANILPGPVAVNIVVYCGFRIGGALGAFLALFFTLLPSFLMMIIFGLSLSLLSHRLDLAVMNNLVSGVAFGIILSAGLQFLKKYCVDLWTWSVFILSVTILMVIPGYLTILILLLFWFVVAQVMETSDKSSLKYEPRTVNREYLFALTVPALILTLYLIGSSEPIKHIFFQFSKIGLTLFGGAYAVIPMFKEVLVDQKGWISNDDLLMGISLGQLTPGPILISAAFFGQKISGLGGAIAATIGMFVPTALVMLVSMRFVGQVSSSIILIRAFRLIHPYVSALVIFAALSLLKDSVFHSNPVITLASMGSSFILIHILNVKPVWLISLSIGIGLLTLLF